MKVKVNLFLAFLLICLSLTGCSLSAHPDPPLKEKAVVHHPLHIQENKIKPRPVRYGPFLYELRSYPLASPLPEGVMPHRLVIPAIKLDSLVEPVGVLPNGQMDVPKAFDRVGILSPWTKPGMAGNAVIAGHFDHYTGPAVFYKLRKLKPGDPIMVNDAQGKTLTFRVKKIESYPSGQAPIDSIFGPSPHAQLNLITCSGKFNRKTQEHANRLVVFSELSY